MDTYVHKFDSTQDTGVSNADRELARQGEVISWSQIHPGAPALPLDGTAYTWDENDPCLAIP